MTESNIENVAAASAYELGNLMGRHEALGLIAIRCTAADAAALRQIREKELWRSEAQTWNEFCETRLKMSRGNANRLIKLLEEFGETYFTISQATRISPQTYRAIAPAIRDNALHVDGEAIALTEENAPRIAAAVEALRRTLEEPAPAPEPEDPLEAFDRHARSLMLELTELSSAIVRDSTGCAILRSILALMQSRLRCVDEEIVAARDGRGERAA